VTSLYAALWIFLRGALLFLVLFFALIFFFQGRFIYFPAGPLAGTPADAGLLFEDIRFPATDGTLLSGWFVPVTPVEASRGTILFCHGNAGNMSHRLDSILIFHEMKLDVFIFDYRGYGTSAGRPTEEGTCQDAEGAWRYLAEKRGIPPEKIILFGRSLGASIAACLAGKTQPRGLIVESSFISIPDLAAEIYPCLPLNWVLRFRYPTRDCLRRVRCPVLVIHSREDEIIPFRHGKALYQAVGGPGHFLEITGGHNDGFVSSGSLYREGLRDFIFPLLDGRAS